MCTSLFKNLNKSYQERLKYSKLKSKKKADHSTKEKRWKKIILKGNISTTYIEHEPKNTGIGFLIHLKNTEKFLDFLLKYEINFPG